MLTEFAKVIKICENYTINSKFPDSVENISALMALVNPILSGVKVVKEDLPYGRYLLHMDSAKRFNLQIHVFSANYEGAIHCHNTWGVMTIIKGLMYVTDWIERKNHFQCYRASLIKEGCSVSFCPPAQDWHKTDTSKSNSQAVSFHIYGEGWDMEKGIYVDKGFEKRISERGVIKDNSLLLPYIICS